MDFINMYITEHVKELGLLSVDLVLFGFSYYAYNQNRHNIACIHQSKYKGENVAYKYNDLENNTTYGLVKGTVTPIGKPLTSFYDNSITGVVQKISITEHVASRGRYGFWNEHSRVLHERNNSSPFYLVNEKFKISVQDVLCANLIDMHVTYDKFEESSPSVMDLLLIIASGSRQRGIQTTEEMLKVGTEVSIIGDIIVGKDNLYTIAPPKDKPFYIITGSVQTLLSHLESNKKLYKGFSIVFGAIAVAILFYSGKKVYAKYKAKKAKEERDRKLQETRHQRRAAMRDTDIVEELRCVICQTNGREIVYRPCGHFCVCEDCNDSITSQCPMCRTVIQDRIPTYL